MKIGSAVVLREPVILVGPLFGTNLLPKGTRGVVRAESGGLVSLVVDGDLYTDIPTISVIEVPEGGDI